MPVFSIVFDFNLFTSRTSIVVVHLGVLPEPFETRNDPAKPMSPLRIRGESVELRFKEFATTLPSESTRKAELPPTENNHNGFLVPIPTKPLGRILIRSILSVLKASATLSLVPKKFLVISKPSLPSMFHSVSVD